MNIKKMLKISRIFILAAIIFALFIFLTNESAAVCQANYCAGYSFGSALGAFIIDLLFVLFAMMFWFVSPIGILFILGVKLFFSENASMARKNFAMLLQFLSFLSWSSTMFILLVVYIDSVSYGILNLGGSILNLAIKSGIGFFIFMLILASLEKKMISSGKTGEDGKSDNINNKDNFNESDSKKKNNGPEKRKSRKESVKIAGIEFGEVKEKIKNKIKKEIKEIVDDKIDKL
jgi:hypothetical protein